MLNKIIDDVLSQQIANDIDVLLTGDSFPWFFMPCVVNPGDTSAGQYLTHIFYDKHQVNSDFYKIIEPLLDVIKPRSLVRAKANLYPTTTTVTEHGFHVDYDWKDVYTAVYYVNNNNGYTALSDGTKIESVKNRLTILDPLVYHTSSTSTNGPRLVININWF